MKILFVAPIHHPEALRAAREATPAGQEPPLFPESVSQHFWERALRRRGHTLAAFYRTDSALGLNERSTVRFSDSITPGKIVRALFNRLPARLNPDYRLRNQRLLAQALEFAPDLVWVVGDNNVIYPETLAEIKRQTGAKVAYFCGTSPQIFAPRIDREAARLYDLVVANDFYHGMQWRELGTPRMICLPMVACDPDFHRPYALSSEERQQLACDVAFIGTLVPDHLYSLRVAALEALREFDLGIWTIHDVPESLRPYVRGRALGEAVPRILSACKISVNPHGDFMRYGGNIRLFEVAAAGVFQISDDLPGIQQWFTVGENIVTYQDEADLKAKVRHYLNDDAARERIAAAGRQHVYAHHTYDVRVAELEAELAKIL